MTDTEKRLIRCFQAVFPELSESDATDATTLRVAAWDSMATVTLAAAVEEEFGIQFEPEELENLTSYQYYMKLLATT